MTAVNTYAHLQTQYFGVIKRSYSFPSTCFACGGLVGTPDSHYGDGQGILIEDLMVFLSPTKKYRTIISNRSQPTTASSHILSNSLSNNHLIIRPKKSRFDTVIKLATNKAQHAVIYYFLSAHIAVLACLFSCKFLFFTDIFY